MTQHLSAITASAGMRGSTSSGGNLTLSSTSHATKGKINLGGSSAFDEVNTRLGIGTASPGVALDVTGQVSASTIAQAPTVQGGTGSGGTLTLKSTTHATKGKILFGSSGYDEVNDRLGVGNSTPSVALDVTGQVSASTIVQTPTVQGSTASGGDLTLKSTTHATKGTIFLGAAATSGFDEVNGRLGIGTASPSVALEVEGAADISGNLVVGGDLSITGIGQMIYVEKSGDQTNATTTLANVTGMSFTAVANAKYLIMLRVAYDAPTATDIKISWTVPSGATMQRYAIVPQAGITDNAATSVVMQRRAANTSLVGGGPNATSTGFTCWWEDIQYNVSSTGGTTQLQFAANGSGTATFRDVSQMLIIRLA